MTVDIIIEEGDWPGDLPDLARRAVHAALEGHRLDPDDHEVALLATSDVVVAELNRRFRGLHNATDVLSFPAAELALGDVPPEALGDIALAWETCAAGAEARGKAFADHLAHLIVHATLHLLGHDHDAEAEATLMEAAETRILAGLGISDPYADGKDP